MSRQKFDRLRGLIEEQYPAPIALISERYRQSEDGLFARYKILTDYCEAFLEFLGAVVIQEGFERLPNFTELLPEGEATFHFLKHPSIGNWISLLEVVSKLENVSPEIHWINRISEWRKSSGEDIGAAIKSLTDIPEVTITFGKNAPPTVAQLLEVFSNLRNRNVAHVPMMGEDALKQRLPIVESALANLLKSATFLKEMLVFHTDQVAVASDSQHQITARILRGLNNSDREIIIRRDALLPQAVYLTVASDRQLERNPVRLSPFILWRTDESGKQPQAFFYNYHIQGKLHYFSYSTGSVCFPSDLKEPFKKIIDLRVIPGEVDLYRGLSEEERTERSEYLYKRASYLAEEGHLKLAREWLEQALEYRNSPKFYAAIARVTLDLGDPPESALPLLESCLEIEPGNPQALSMLEEIRTGVRRTISVAQGASGERNTIFHLFCPNRARGHAINLWGGGITLWFLFSLVMETSYGKNRNALALVFALLGCLACIYAAGMLRPWLYRLKTSLFQQVWSGDAEQFDAWYKQQLAFIFGDFALSEGKVQFGPSIRREKYYYLGSLAWLGLMVPAAIGFSQSQAAPLPLLFKRTIDYTLLFGIVYYAARYTVAVTVFVNRYSHRTLIPMLTKINEDGVRSLGPFIAFSILLAIGVYSLFHLSFALAYTIPQHIDLLFLCVGTSLAAAWTIAFPFQLRRALKASKLDPVQKYSKHIHLAFKAFLNDPSQANEDKYVRLLEMQKLIRKIPVWPMTAFETVVVLGGGNLVLSLVTTAYVVTRLGSWEAVGQFLTRHLPWVPFTG